MKNSKTKFTLSQWIQIFKRGRKFYHLADLMKLSGLKLDAARKAAYRLVREDILVKLRPEFFANSFCNYQAEEVANTIYPPSYISCETALFHYGVIDQAPFVIVSVSTRKSRRMRVKNNAFIYHKMAFSLFWGFTQKPGFRIAEPEKALLDWLYLMSRKGLKPSLDELNWEQLNKKKLRLYARRFPKYVIKSHIL
ncbi:MAG: hypothetical protein A3G32_03790 [Deltaproteobacteria bacterium RIFCSPLOWO2_12_FULL_40_28]|nr:MAG: hypothetical protein A3C45_05680 [Deltaproteobacteria bacterium RIFCSPHIGHO2_02_FULL_40_28]OGQ19443.1 MAG: hypothetical protein A3E27_06310 [Deltaproteobacteria bacterium RIFCSPHIGHO2_12_FULL_40_32]OGQ39887.1 MAG: hypothetical protein A3I69_07275 [Deltaproteobacteria bacterium RIFCSPLOWO2_02_FULL_40_36]OGQ53880.1 MAG: hypothetical protein A3G32_03790 [Deltaproteobacteria bacterium RIFCSPLOWO2_12_FULL_40_28]